MARVRLGQQAMERRRPAWPARRKRAIVDRRRLQGQVVYGIPRRQGGRRCYRYRHRGQRRNAGPCSMPREADGRVRVPRRIRAPPPPRRPHCHGGARSISCRRGGPAAYISMQGGPRYAPASPRGRHGRRRSGRAPRWNGSRAVRSVGVRRKRRADDPRPAAAAAGTGPECRHAVPATLPAARGPRRTAHACPVFRPSCPQFGAVWAVSVNFPAALAH